LKEAIRHFEDFYEEVFTELCQYGELEGLYVCDNVGEHLMGNVYAKYYREDDAKTALTALNGRFYAGKRLTCEYSPVTYFRVARCRQYDDQMCNRGGYCNYMHLKHVSKSFKRSLFRQMYEDYPEYRKRRQEYRML
jgi:splicing factor U2AF subunit